MSRRPKVHVGARLPAKLVERVDARVQAWRAALPGMKVTRTDLITILLDAGLRDERTEAPKPTRLDGRNRD